MFSHCYQSCLKIVCMKTVIFDKLFLWNSCEGEDKMCCGRVFLIQMESQSLRPFLVTDSLSGDVHLEWHGTIGTCPGFDRSGGPPTQTKEGGGAQQTMLTCYEAFGEYGPISIQLGSIYQLHKNNLVLPLKLLL